MRHGCLLPGVWFSGLRCGVSDRAPKGVNAQPRGVSGKRFVLRNASVYEAAGKLLLVRLIRPGFVPVLVSRVGKSAARHAVISEPLRDIKIMVSVSGTVINVMARCLTPLTNISTGRFRAWNALGVTGVATPVLRLMLHRSRGNVTWGTGSVDSSRMHAAAVNCRIHVFWPTRDTAADVKARYFSAAGNHSGKLVLFGVRNDFRVVASADGAPKRRAKVLLGGRHWCDCRGLVA